MFRQSPYGIHRNIVYGSTAAERTDENVKMVSHFQTPKVKTEQAYEKYIDVGGHAPAVDHEAVRKSKKQDTSELADLYYRVELQKAREAGLIQPFMSPYDPRHKFTDMYNARHNDSQQRMAGQVQAQGTATGPSVPQQAQAIRQSQAAQHQRAVGNQSVVTGATAAGVRTSGQVQRLSHGLPAVGPDGQRAEAMGRAQGPIDQGSVSGFTFLQAPTAAPEPAQRVAEAQRAMGDGRPPRGVPVRARRSPEARSPAGRTSRRRPEGSGLRGRRGGPEPEGEL
jgi:hypothetical protein